MTDLPTTHNDGACSPEAAPQPFDAGSHGRNVTGPLRRHDASPGSRQETTTARLAVVEAERYLALPTVDADSKRVIKGLLNAVADLVAMLRAEIGVSQEHFGYYLSESGRVGVLRAALSRIATMDRRYAETKGMSEIAADALDRTTDAAAEADKIAKAEGE